MDDAITALTFSMYSSNGAYAMLLGSGVSRAAGIPTGWDIVLDLCQKMAAIQGDDTPSDPAAWYLAKTGRPPRYDDLIDALAPTPTLRSNLLRPYFEPTAANPVEGDKAPTQTHKAVAQLASQGHTRLILTTNFDRLLELALEEAGVDFQVAYTPNMLRGLRPYSHAPCTVLKLHGDYRDTRLLNTAGELQAYDDELLAYLHRVFDDFGFLVAGWSATWDVALRDAILSSPSMRYSWHWLSVGSLSDEASDIIRNKNAGVLKATSADALFTQLLEGIEALHRLNSKHPLSASMAIAAAKNLIERNPSPVALQDLVTDELKVARQKIAELRFSHSLPSSEFRRQLEVYESAFTISASVLAVVSAFGPDEHHRNDRNLIMRALATLPNTLPPSGILNTNLATLRLYPALLAMYAVGVAAVANQKWPTLEALLTSWKIHNYMRIGQLMSAIEVVVVRKILNVEEMIAVTNTAQGRDRTAHQYLFDIVAPLVSATVFDEVEYQRAFDVFEFVVSMAQVRVSPDEWPSYGRFPYHDESRAAVTDFVRTIGEEGEGNPMIALIFNGDLQTFESALDKLQRGCDELLSQTSTRWSFVSAYHDKQ